MSDTLEGFFLWSTLLLSLPLVCPGPGNPAGRTNVSRPQCRVPVPPPLPCPSPHAPMLLLHQGTVASVYLVKEHWYWVLRLLGTGPIGNLFFTGSGIHFYIFEACLELPHFSVEASP